MAGLWFLRRHSAHCATLAFTFGLILATRASAQDPRGVTPGVRPDINSEADQLADGQPAGRPDPVEGARYIQPPLPPYAHWPPTWMPCQSLRTNRSLVLGPLSW